MARKPPRIDTAAKIEEIIAESVASAVDSLQHDFAWSLHRRESPIEKLFAAALIDPRTTSEYFTRLELLNPKSGLIEHCNPPPYAGLFMWQQIKIEQYRVDFLLKSDHPEDPMLVVEIDGHDWHEKTKQQAQRDKARDRYLVGRGFRVLRFTGSEVFADPYEAAHEALQILLNVRH